MPRRSDQTERQDVLRRFFALSDRDQLEAFEEIRAQLAAKPGEEPGHDREIGERKAALEAIGRVAKHLGLAKGNAPTVSQFRDGCRELGLDSGPSRVIRIWGRWRFATEAYLGGRQRRTAATRSRRRQQAGRERSHEEYLEGIRRWLATDPASKTGKDYDEWVTEQTAQLSASERPNVGVSALRNALGLRWDDIVAVAEGRLDLTRAREARVTALLAEHRGRRQLVGPQVAALLLGRAAQDVKDLAPLDKHFPVSVAMVGRSQAWLVSDIEAFRDGRRPPRRTNHELQGKLILSGEIAERLGIGPDTFRTYIQQKQWKRAPQPAGKVAGFHYWWRAEAEKWLSARGV